MRWPASIKTHSQQTWQQRRGGGRETALRGRGNKASCGLVIRKFFQKTIDELWGEDPVHPSQAGYQKLLAALGPLAASARDTGRTTEARKIVSPVNGWPEGLPTRERGNGHRGVTELRGRWLRGGSLGHLHSAGPRERGSSRVRGRRWPY
jgi:hypothetical protein